MTAKKQVGLRVEGRLKDGLQDQAKRSGKAETSLLEEYIAAGLARDNGELIEESSLPAIRVAVREELGKAMQDLYGLIQTSLTRRAR
jgi:hypothetical protein